MELGKIDKGIWVLTFEGKENNNFFWIGYNSTCLESTISNKFRMLQRYGGYPSKENNVSTYGIPEVLKEFLNKNNGYDSLKGLFVVDCDNIKKDRTQIKLSLAKYLIDNNYNTTDETKREIDKNKNILDINALLDIDLYKESVFDKYQSYKLYRWDKTAINSIVGKEDLIVDDEEVIDLYKNKEIIELLKIEAILQERTINDLFEDIISEKARKIHKLKL